MKIIQSEQEFNNKWNIHKTVQEAVKSAHLEPSPETKERLVALEVNQKNIMDKLEEMNISNKEAHNGIVEMIVKIEDKLDKALEKKANKWVEVLVIWVGRSIGVGLLAVIGGLIIKAIIHFNG